MSIISWWKKKPVEVASPVADLSKEELFKKRVNGEIDDDVFLSYFPAEFLSESHFVQAMLEEAAESKTEIDLSIAISLFWILKDRGKTQHVKGETVSSLMFEQWHESHEDLASIHQRLSLN